MGGLLVRYWLVSLLVLALPLFPTPKLYADNLWLDESLVPWNGPGMPIPAAPPLGNTPGPLNYDMCARTVRPTETGEDGALVGAGWYLQGPYHRGWGVSLVTATNDWDGMCRPAGYQGFVFVDGAFAGTVAPDPTFARTDGSFREIRLLDANSLMATFTRYADTDPLCCPSRGTSSVTYRIDRTASGPVLVPTDVFTSGTSD